MREKPAYDRSLSAVINAESEEGMRGEGLPERTKLHRYEVAMVWLKNGSSFEMFDDPETKKVLEGDGPPPPLAGASTMREQNPLVLRVEVEKIVKQLKGGQDCFGYL